MSFLKTIGTAAGFALFPVAGLSVATLKAVGEAKSLRQDITNQSTSWRDESARWRDQTAALGKNMVEAADKLDPFSIKELFRKTENLREINDGLRKTITDLKVKPVLAYDLRHGERLQVQCDTIQGGFHVEILMDDDPKKPLMVEDFGPTDSPTHHPEYWSTTTGTLAQDGYHTLNFSIKQRATRPVPWIFECSINVVSPAGAAVPGAVDRRLLWWTGADGQDQTHEIGFYVRSQP